MEGRKGGVQNSNVNYTPPPLQTPHSITYSRVMNGSVCCVIIYYHTRHMLIRQQLAFTRSGKTNEAANQGIRLRGTNKKLTFAELLTEE
jgi:hypothetical protein